jgi:hypothetical protein
MPGLDAREVTPKLKLRLKFYCSWTWCLFFFLFVCFCFCLFVCSFFPLISLRFFLFGWLVWFSIFTSFLLSFFLSILSTFPSSSSRPYSHPFHSPSCAKIICPPPPNNSFCPFLPTLSLALTFPSHSSPTCHQTTPPSYTLITHWPTYYTNFIQPQPPAVPDKALSTTITETHPNTHRTTKTAATTLLSPLTHPTSHLPL